MATTRRKAPARKAPVRRRRMASNKVTSAKVNAAVMNSAKAAAGGMIAAILTNTVGKVVGAQYAPWTGLAGSVATGLFLKQPEIAAGMAGYSGSKVMQALPAVGTFLQDNAAFAGAPSSMYLSEGKTDVYASNYSLAGYEVPGL